MVRPPVDRWRAPAWGGAAMQSMRIGIACLVAGYALSQFYRAFLAVLAPVLEVEIGATKPDLAAASSLWFLTFAVMQLPVGWALDRIGPRRTAALLLGFFGAGGAAVFAAAQTPWHLSLAMGLIGVGCAPVLMASYYIFARSFAPAVFGTLAGAMIGVGSLGNLAAALPLGAAVQAFGWRPTSLGLAVVTGLVALLIWRAVQDPPRVTAPTEAGVGMWSILRSPGFVWVLPILIVGYAPAAGVRGLWAGPYAGDVFGASATEIGMVTLAMGVAMTVGTVLYGPADRLLGSRKWVIFAGNTVALAALVMLWLAPDAGLWQATAALCALGLFGMAFPLMIAHGRAFFPPHLVGRGVTLLNLCSIGGVGVFQILSGQVHQAALVAGASVAEAHAAVFGMFALALAVGLLLYLPARDRID
jgi:MFS family permease